MECGTALPSQEIAVSVLPEHVYLLSIYSLALPTNGNLLLKYYGRLPSIFESIGRYQACRTCPYNADWIFCRSSKETGRKSQQQCREIKESEGLHVREIILQRVLRTGNWQE
jgi:hypothetical protein